MNLLYFKCFNPDDVYQYLMKQTLEAIFPIAMTELTSASTFQFILLFSSGAL